LSSIYAKFGPKFSDIERKTQDFLTTFFPAGKFFAIQTAWGVKLDDEGGI